MATYKRNDVSKIIKGISQGKLYRVYLIVGDRFLCLDIANQLGAALIPDKNQLAQNLKLIDGDQEDPLNTLNILRSYNLFGGRQVLRVNDSKLFHSKAVAKKLWDKSQKSFEKKDLKSAAVALRQMTDAGGLSIDELTDLSAAKWKSAFGFNRPQAQLSWIDEVLATGDGLSESESKPSRIDPADLYMDAFQSGLPDNNFLILLAETVDKRKRFYKFIQKHGAVLDVSVAAGSSKAARSEQETVLKELISKTLAGFGKKIDPRAVPVLLERVGFHPVAVVRETEKLALFSGDAPVITVTDLEAIVGRTREEALYELTEAFADRDLDKALLVTSRLSEGGIHPLVLVSGLRNMLRKLLLVCSLRESSTPVFVEGMNFGVFQKGYLPELKQVKEEWLAKLPSHPYALYMMFIKAKKHSIGMLTGSLVDLLKAEYRLKSTTLPPIVVFEKFLWKALG